MDIRGDKCRIGINAPKSIPVHRREVTEAIKRNGEQRPFARCALLNMPPDVADAYESFKLAIMRHRLDGWREIGRQDLLDCLTALADLARSDAA